MQIFYMVQQTVRIIESRCYGYVQPTVTMLDNHSSTTVIRGTILIGRKLLAWLGANFLAIVKFFVLKKLKQQCILIEMVLKV